jgi:hydrogenase nickel incorporation protein HypB
MCNVCGCSDGETRIEGHSHTHGHHHHSHDDHGHHHHHHHDDHNHTETLHFGEGAAGVSVAGLSQTRLIEIETDILSRNNADARRNRGHFVGHGVIALNLVSSPGAGKTTLLVETLKRLADEAPVAVIEGDQETSADAERIRATGAPAIQVNTGKGCHLDAAMVGQAFDHLHDHLHDGGYLFIENVGNLVCPSAFDLGEAYRVVVASVTEGEDKPLKYPNIFASAQLMLVSKADLAGPCDADVDLLIANARRVNPGLKAITVSAKTGDGMDRWIGWLKAARALQAAAE